ncbi:MAG: gliding motility-associated C-terminal domain-containing protein [Flavobacteriales bacterium]|nr:gliding motility-associated C-terminal domain-containing protein [Flavobacteriales bacterium]
MKDGLENIDEVFKQAFDGFEANVDPSVWTNVQQAIGGGVAPQANPASSAAGSAATKAVVLKIASAVIAIGTIATAGYFAVDAMQDETQPTVIVEQREPVTAPEMNVAEDVVETQGQDVEVETTSIEMHENQPEPVVEADRPVQQPEVNQPEQPSATNHAPNDQSANNPKQNAPETDSNRLSTSNEEEEQPEYKKLPQSDVTPEDDLVVTPPVQPERKVEPQEAQVDVIPNVFSPNGDNQNDVIKITGTNLQKIEVVIMDKTGKPVYRITSLEDEWNGKDQAGFDLMPGIYYMAGIVVDKDGHTKNIKQAINLFK